MSLGQSPGLPETHSLRSGRAFFSPVTSEEAFRLGRYGLIEVSGSHVRETSRTSARGSLYPQPVRCAAVNHDGTAVQRRGGILFGQYGPPKA